MLIGEEVIIAKGKKPLVKQPVLQVVQQQRRLGGAKNAILEISDDFDEPIEAFQDNIPLGV